jgi:hypothetical protein
MQHHVSKTWLTLQAAGKVNSVHWLQYCLLVRNGVEDSIREGPCHVFSFVDNLVLPRLFAKQGSTAPAGFLF